MSAEDRIKELGIELPTPPGPVGNYIGATRTGNLIYLSGHGPRNADGSMISGKVGADMDIDEAYAVARIVGLGLMATLKAHIGDLNKVKQVIKTLGMVNAVPEFNDHPKVINGASDLFVDVFGDAGRGARSAVGMGSLPNQIPVEVEMIIEIED
jgi:enamine deaminase RidA (YjgF/YER057c/UK114 family)